MIVLQSKMVADAGVSIPLLDEQLHLREHFAWPRLWASLEGRCRGGGSLGRRAESATPTTSSWGAKATRGGGR